MPHHIHPDVEPASTRLPAPADRTIAIGLLVVLALLSALAPFGIDMYLPGFPSMVTELKTSTTAVQLTLTGFLVGIAIGQLIFGPLSDRVGRLKPLVIGTGVCVIASIAAATAPTVGVLVAARFAQGLTGASGMVIGRAIISDLAIGKAAARAFSVMMLVSGVAPVLAPFLGSLLIGPIGWRGVLWTVFGLAAAMALAVVLVVRESHTSDRRAAAREHRPEFGSANRDLLSRAYLGNTFAFAFAFAVMMAYISASPFVYQVMLGLNAVEYGMLFAVNALGLVVMSAVAARLAATFPVRRLLEIGLVLVFGATVTLLIVVLTGGPLWLIPFPIFVAVTSLGLVLGNATALALAAVPRAAGAGSAALGALQFGLGALVSPLVSIAGEHTAIPLAIVMASVATIAIAAHFITGERRTLSD